MYKMLRVLTKKLIDIFLFFMSRQQLNYQIKMMHRSMNVSKTL